MAIINEVIKQKQGYKLHIVNTGKYKTNTFVWKMKAPLQKETVTLRSLFPYVLQSNTKNYPSTTVLRSHLDDLYGASLYVDLSKKGEYHIITFTVEIANEKFLTDPAPLLEKGMGLLAEVLFNPNASHNSFDESTVNNEKRTLKQRIQSSHDDKMRYSANRLVQEMCQNEPYALDPNGELKDIDAITPESLYQYYKQALAQDELDFYVIGDVQESEVEKAAEQLFKLQERTPESAGETAKKEIKEVNEVIERQDIKQGKLNIGYRTNIVYGDSKYYALQVFNGIFGGFSHSKLFINVREKASLAYYASARVESHKGLLMVMSGIENKNYDQAVTIIKEQMEAMKNGDFTEDEISQTKAVIRNQMLETIDIARGLVEILYHGVVSGVPVEMDEWLEKTDAITHGEIVEAAKEIELDTIYFLTGMEGQ
ncbi:putative Zn-dependent peptidase [Peribacillus deserti]|uniref:Zn-dependent peptidase n=1 Tax=Peribacillus deserti TaxID=673318 RepID=A0ABS2QP97_9BACI|nr:pitrilysin family protein [Peribacillus deserti]MBM7694765.1 putative Zn-dependent peptidase [Peribacillus deserti]